MWEVLFEGYRDEGCYVEKCDRLAGIREITGLTYTELALELGETERTLKRVNKLQKLEGKFREMLKDGSLKVSMAYELTNLTLDKQEEIYNLFKDRLVSWNFAKFITEIVSGEGM